MRATQACVGLMGEPGDEIKLTYKVDIQSGVA